MTVAIVLLTYGGNKSRREYAQRTLHEALPRLRCSDELVVHIADDGSPTPHRAELRAIAQDYGFAVSITDAQHRGYGANMNAALDHLRGKVSAYLMLEDDWLLTDELDLDPLLAAFSDEIGCIRLGYLGTTQPLYGEVMHRAGRTYLRFEHDSAEPHVFAGHPRLQSAAWTDFVGAWPEYQEDGSPASPGQTEFMVAHMPNARRGVAWPLDLHGCYASGTLFGHIGSVHSEDT